MKTPRILREVVHVFRSGTRAATPAPKRAASPVAASRVSSSDHIVTARPAPADANDPHGWAASARRVFGDAAR